jgi:ferrous iron transport protein A
MHPLNLNSLQSGNSAVITGVQAETSLGRRLVALGFRTGRQVYMLRKASFSGPIHVRIGTTEVMVRRRDAHAIQIAALVS